MAEFVHLTQRWVKKTAFLECELSNDTRYL